MFRTVLAFALIVACISQFLEAHSVPEVAKHGHSIEEKHRHSIEEKLGHSVEEKHGHSFEESEIVTRILPAN